MRKVTICKGLPASGKSTWAKEKVAKSNCSIKRINKDDLRAMLDSTKYSKGNEKFILKMRNNILLSALFEGKGVIIDDTNFYPAHEESIREVVSDYNNGMLGEHVMPKNPVQVEVKFFDVSPEECIKRDLKRPNSVGAKVIWDMYNKYLKPEAEKIEVMKQDESLPHAIICDLDGTIALMNGRDPYKWEECDNDLPNKEIINIIQTYLRLRTSIIFLSGRDGRGEGKTRNWLKKNLDFLGTDCNLYMRTPHDNRKDSIIKKELFDAHIKGKYYVDFILDDRNQVVELWRSMGLTCLQVQDGDF